MLTAPPFAAPFTDVFRMIKHVDIAGGGVAGLALGLALRRAGVPVRVHEAGTYPRHRLCGEFLSGIGGREFDELGLGTLFAETEVLRDMAWFSGNRLAFRDALPEPAYALSRWRMEAAMAEQLTACGGRLICEDRVPPPPDPEGWVFATGRPAAQEGRWYAEKQHYQNLESVAGLEMHLGAGGYTGLARIGGGVVNVCAMLPAAAGKIPQATLTDRLRAGGLTNLAARLERAQAVPGTRCGTSRFSTGWQPQPGNGAMVHLGDRAAIIPPFTGNGMSMAIQAALESVGPLTTWSACRAPWSETVQTINDTLRRRFRRRLRWSATLHPFLLHPAFRFFLHLVFRSGINASRWFYHKVHS